LACTEVSDCSLYVGIVNKDGAAIYKYMHFNQTEAYVESA
jgi:hypothetical protein